MAVVALERDDGRAICEWQNSRWEAGKGIVD